jgi:hypothetical protein
VAHASPVVSEPLFLPGDNRTGLHEGESLLPTRPQP